MIGQRWGAVTLLGVMAAGYGCARDGRDAQRQFLVRSWDAYKDGYISADGYVLDSSRHDGEVTSEGQAYALVRASWMRDEAMFSHVLRWTEARLRRPDGLYSWRWSPKRGGQVLDPNTASDADQEIAFALILGSHVFRQPAYLRRAREILRAVRTVEGIAVGSAWFPSAGNWAVQERIVNLSYFVPYAYPYFVRADPEGQWDRVVDVGYSLVSHTLELPGVRLIPDFMLVGDDGAVQLLPAGSSLSRDFSFDAMRIFWRVAVDCRVHRRMRACADPVGARALAGLLARDGAIFTRYRVDGVVLDRRESLSFYGSALPLLLIHAPALGQSVFSERMSPEALTPLLPRRDRYYDLNWIWFGLAAADGLIADRTPPPAAVIR